jgi:hypothetical protein
MVSRYLRTGPAVAATPAAELYKADFYAWARGQADALRRLAETRPDVEIDLEHLIEEVEGLARTDLRAASSQLRRLMIHLLKLAHARAPDPRLGWARTVDNARAEIDDVMTAALRADVEPLLPKLYAQARREAAKDLLEHREPEAAAALPEACPYNLDLLLTDDWYPAGPGGGA